MFSRLISYQGMFRMGGAHPAPSRQCGERRVQAVHVKQQRAVVALDQRGSPTAPVYTIYDTLIMLILKIENGE